MKLIKLFLIVITVSTVMSFTAKDNLFKVDIEKSKLTWVGKKVTGAHTGTINLTEGSFVTNGKKVTGGSFAIDMTSITDTDITNPGGNEKLVNHLKSDDFFGSEKHPKANLVITSIGFDKNQYNIKGNLTIKGITNTVEFPAEIQMLRNQLIAKAKILVDRTKFDIKIRSENFFENLGDKTIEDNFELNVELIAAPGI